MDHKSIEIVMEKLLDKKLSPIVGGLNDIKQKISQIEDSVSFLSDQQDVLINKVKEVEEKNNTILHKETRNYSIDLFNSSRKNLTINSYGPRMARYC